jgi:hypothetical protein
VAVRKKKEPSWEVFRLRASAEYLGIVSARDEGAALQRAIKAFAITAVHQQKSLMVRRARSRSV